MVGVNEVVVLDQVVGGPDLILCFEHTEVLGDRGAELAALESAAAVVDGVQDVLQLRVRRYELVPVEVGEGLGGTLRVRAAIRGESSSLISVLP